MRRLGGGAAAVLHDVDVIPCAQHLDGGPGHADLRPETGHEDVLLPGGLNGGTEAGIIPGVHGGAFHHRLAGEHIQELRPNVAAEGFRLHRGEHGGDVELLGHLGQERHVVDQGSAVDVGDAKGHLRLVVDEDNRAVLGRVEFVVGAHGVWDVS